MVPDFVFHMFTQRNGPPSLGSHSVGGKRSTPENGLGDLERPGRVSFSHHATSLLSDCSQSCYDMHASEERLSFMMNEEQ